VYLLIIINHTIFTPSIASIKTVSLFLVGGGMISASGVPMAQSILNMDGWMLLHPQYPQSGAHPQWWIAPAVPGGVHDTLASLVFLSLHLFPPNHFSFVQ
jgi:hypothetical protein